MNTDITLPRLLLNSTPNVLWVYANLLDIADDLNCANIKVSRWCEDLGLTHKQLRSALNFLAMANFLAIERANNSTHITLNLPTKYKQSEKKTGQAKRQPKGQTLTDENLCNTLSIEPNTKARFIKPTIQEIETYISEGNYSVDAQIFFDHYESVGWMRGKTKMKDWKATIRTWNRNQYGIHQTQIKDKYTARRGTDAGNYSENDYGGPF